MLPMGVENRVRNPQRRRTSTQVSSWGNFTPMALGADGWWDASDTSTLTQSGSAVSQWNDKSGWGRNFVQATSANRPVTGSNTQNGLTTITFDGVNDGMTANGGANGKLHTSMFCLMKFIGGSAQSVPFCAGAGGTIGNLRSALKNASPNIALSFTQWGGGGGSNLNWDVNGAFRVYGFTTTTAALVTMSRDRSTNQINSGGIVTMNSDNVEIGFLSTPTAGNWANIAVGEIVLFHRTVTPQERDLLTNYFNAKWGLGI